MPYRGSSRIITIATEIYGKTGNTGPTGDVGNTGNYVTGPDGPQGMGVTGITYNSVLDGLTFYIEGSTAVYLTGFRGNTGDSATLSPPIISSIGIGVSFVGSSGYTLFFRSITFSNGISASISGESIVIRDNIGDTGSFDANRILFVDYAGGTYFINSSDFVKYKESYYSSVTYGNFEANIKFARDLFGVENFNYSTGSVQNSDHSGLTMTIDSAFYGVTGTEADLKAGTWNPYLKYRANYYDLNGASGSIFSTINFSPLGPYTKQIKFTVELGSCCYCEDCVTSEITGRKCQDYVLKEYCQSIGGRWNKSTCYNRQNSFDCYRRRACCVNGTCINTSFEKCQQMGGEFCSFKECGLDYACGDECTQTAPGGPGSGTTICCCCQNGVPIQGECSVLEPECVSNGGVFFDDRNCDTVDCCDLIVGACCKDGSCSSMSPVGCQQIQGVFYGQGVSCNQINCCDPV